ncbi:MAG: Nif11-like leader peptide family natural product precursor [Ruminiclostridium sp.]|nr:Nif11-like leader peptide family natural product precursor [Ruminiclostridium sp.]
MSKEIAKKLIAELETNEELKAKVEGVSDPEELLKIAKASGYDVTIEELIEAEKESRKSKAAETDEKLSFDDLENVAGGTFWRNDDAPDGHEIGCKLCYHGIDWCRSKDIWCNKEFWGGSAL